MNVRSLGFRTSLFVGIVLTAGLSGSVYFWLRQYETGQLALKKEEANLLTETVKASLVHAMRQGDDGREAIHQAIRQVSAREEIERIRIFNAVGRIRYSSDEAEMGRIVDKEAENCRQCHTGDEPPRPGITERARLFYTPEDADEARHRVLGVINPIYNEPEQGCTDCHREQSVLGVLDAVFSLEHLDQEIRAHRGSLIFFGLLGVVVLVAATALVIRVLVQRPVRELVEGARKVGQLDLDHRLPADRGDELGKLARAFNEMTERLQRARGRLRSFTDDLETKVREKTTELEAAQEQMVRSEKMAAIGQMAAGVAHEINNPLTGVITFASLLRRRLDPDGQERKDVETIIEEARRCSEIARGLLDFARSGDLDRRRVDVRRLLGRVLKLVENQALFHNIELVRDFGAEVPDVFLDQGRIEQVFLNLVMNSAEAMDGRGRLTLRVTRRGEEHIVVEVSDTGPGIPADIRSRVFDPFFTTKEAGQGTGLGLAVSYRIVADHGGRIELETESGRGTTFRILLPVGSGEDEP